MITQNMTFEQILDKDGQLMYANKGVSMRPLIREGRDVMQIQKKDSSVRLKELDAVLFKRPERDGTESYVMHRIIRINRDGTYWIVGDNCITGDTVKEEQILGILTGLIRDSKPFSFNCLGYRLYTHTWCRCYRVRFLLLRMKRFASRCLKRVGLRK